MMQRLYTRGKKVLTARQMLDYGVLFFVYLVLHYSFESFGSLIQRWSHLGGWPQNLLTWAVELAFVLAVAEIWRRIDRRIFGPWRRSEGVLSISLFSGLGDQARYWFTFVVVGASLVAGSLTRSAVVFFVTALGIMGLVYTVSFIVEQHRRHNGVPG
jgi:hypothetical protein